MKKIEIQKKRRLRRKRILRKVILGTPTKPRLTIYKSNKYIYVQAIDDNNGITIASCSSLPTKKSENVKGKLNKDTSFKVGESIAKKLLDKKIDSVIFDRNGFLYTGRVKSLADGARKQGLKF